MISIALTGLTAALSPFTFVAGLLASAVGSLGGVLATLGALGVHLPSLPSLPTL